MNDKDDKVLVCTARARFDSPVDLLRRLPAAHVLLLSPGTAPALKHPRHG